ncbi:MAG: hypothetical protein QOI24_2704 [Acidobacteriota bacterium]|jgi:hypothetical protein|nr:hypothetical protein [Acidobacteriota bacterium]
MKRIVLLLLAVFSLAPAAHAAVVPADVVTVATVNASGPVIDVPVYIRDVSGTPLGVDQPPGSRIQSYSIKVNYAPASAVQSITFTRAGITAPLTPTFETTPSSPGSISLLDTFQESTNPIPFTSNGAVPGNQIGHLTVTLAPSAIPGTVITLTVDPTLTQLTDEGGNGATKESVANANLLLVNGQITVAPAAIIPAMSGWMLVLLGGMLAVVALSIRR